MTPNKQCAQWGGECCMSGHIRTTSLCWGVATGAKPQCLMDEPPEHLITESGLPLAAHIRETSHDNQ